MVMISYTYVSIIKDLLSNDNDICYFYTFLLSLDNVHSYIIVQELFLVQSTSTDSITTLITFVSNFTFTYFFVDDYAESISKSVSSVS